MDIINAFEIDSTEIVSDSNANEVSCAISV